MELMQLEMFVAAVEEGSVHGAAERVCRTQPAVSMALKKLEQEIGSPLFDRACRIGIQLTPAGELLYSYAFRLLALRNEAHAALEALSKLQQGHLRIGSNESISSFLLPKLTHAFYEQYPNIKIETRCANSDQLISELKERKIDLALLGYAPESGEFEKQAIMQDELVLIASPQHRLVQAQCLHIRDLGDESIIIESGSSSLRERVVKAFAHYGTPLNIRIESATIDTIKRMVMMNTGVSFVPLMCVREEVARGELVTVPFEGLSQERTLWVVRRRDASHSHAAKAFMRTIKKEAQNLALQQQANNVVRHFPRQESLTASNRKQLRNAR
jgi:DNA-binding transcriptional LysR family regulator